MSFNYGLRPITINNITMPSPAASTATAAFGSQTELVELQLLHLQLLVQQVYLYLPTNLKYLKLLQVLSVQV